MSNDTPRIRVGIGGWNFAEWRGGVFYPAGLPAAQELHFASRRCRRGYGVCHQT